MSAVSKPVLPTGVHADAVAEITPRMGAMTIGGQSVMNLTTPNTRLQTVAQLLPPITSLLPVLAQVVAAYAGSEAPLEEHSRYCRDLVNRMQYKPVMSQTELNEQEKQLTNLREICTHTNSTLSITQDHFSNVATDARVMGLVLGSLRCPRLEILAVQSGVKMAMTAEDQARDLKMAHFLEGFAEQQSALAHLSISSLAYVAKKSATAPTTNTLEKMMKGPFSSVPRVVEIDYLPTFLGGERDDTAFIQNILALHQRHFLASTRIYNIPRGKESEIRALVSNNALKFMDTFLDGATPLMHHSQTLANGDIEIFYKKLACHTT